MPTITLSPIAIVVAIVVGFFFCYFWNGVLFDKAIRHELGVADGDEPQGAALGKALLMTLVGIAMMAFVLSNNMAVWNPTSWGLAAIEGSAVKLSQAFQAALFTTLGFIVPVLLDAVAWEKRSWKLFLIKVGYYFCLLLILAMILMFL